MAKLLPNLRTKFTDANGDPLAGGKLYSYIAGTSTPLATYTDDTEATPNTNPVVLDANGEANIWVGNSYYKFILTDANDVTIWTIDNVSAVEDVVAAAESAKLAAQAAQTATETAKTGAEAAQTAAASSASAAATSASNATTSASTATTQAGIATTKAGEAATSATSASGSASTATTQAGIATTKAGEAAASATAAAGSAASAAALDVPTIMTTKGDLLSRSSSALVRVPVGADGKFLRADSTQSSGLGWGFLNAVSKTTTYTATTSDDVIAASASGGSWTLTLPTAVGNTGKVLRIIKTDTSTNTVTIATTSSQTIGGRASSDIVLLRPRDFIAVVSDGANWEILAKKETKWLASTSATSATLNSNRYVSLTGNSITITPGQWRVYAAFGIECYASSAIAYLNVGTGVFEANGTNTTTAPTALSGTVYGDSTIGSSFIAGQGSSLNAYITSHTVVFDYHINSSTTIYAVPQVATNGTTAQVKSKIWAERIW